MLPKRSIGDPRPDHWTGLIDGIYAIGLTILALNMPNYLNALGQLKDEGPNHAAIALYLFGVEALTYAALFFILYEIWSFHRAIVCLGSMKSKGLTSLNAIILALISFIPAGMVFHLNRQIEIINQAKLTNTDIFNAISTANAASRFGSGGFTFVFALVFFILSALARQSRRDGNSHDREELTLIAKEALQRGAVLSVLMMIYWVSVNRLQIPMDSLILLILYAVYAFFDLTERLRPKP